MSKKANPTAIGVFIAVGLTLGVAGLLVFSSSRLFSSKARFVIYFETSLNGLHEGAPVKYRGVTVGSVSRLMIKFHQVQGDTAMPVIIEIQDKLIRERLVGPTLFTGLKNVSEEVRHGLRATLETESLVTGVLYVSLEIEQEPPPPVYHEQQQVYIEIPSRPTDIQQLLKNLGRMDVAGLANKISALVTRIDTMLAGFKLGEISESLTNTMTQIERVVASPDLTNSLTSLRQTLDEYHVLAEKLSRRVDPTAEQLTNTLAQASTALSEIRGGVANLREALGPDSALRHDLTLTLEQLASVAQSVSDLADYYRSHPNAFITGRRLEEKKP
jgi:paraquat-inducible protein B